jgi:hypothetical protein
MFLSRLMLGKEDNHIQFFHSFRLHISPYYALTSLLSRPEYVRDTVTQHRPISSQSPDQRCAPGAAVKQPHIQRFSSNHLSTSFYEVLLSALALEQLNEITMIVHLCHRITWHVPQHYAARPMPRLGTSLILDPRAVVTQPLKGFCQLSITN